ncbi:MAG: hypothetical protein ABI175_17335, partial [Polyangiales bacterium]
DVAASTTQPAAEPGGESISPIVAASTPPKTKPKPPKGSAKPQLATKGTAPSKTAAPATTSTSPWGSVIDERK